MRARSQHVFGMSVHMCILSNPHSHVGQCDSGVGDGGGCGVVSNTITLREFRCLLLHKRHVRQTRKKHARNYMQYLTFDNWAHTWIEETDSSASAPISIYQCVSPRLVKTAGRQLGMLIDCIETFRKCVSRRLQNGWAFSAIRSCQLPYRPECVCASVIKIGMARQWLRPMSSICCCCLLFDHEQCGYSSSQSCFLLWFSRTRTPERWGESETVQRVRSNGPLDVLSRTGGGDVYALD